MEAFVTLRVEKTCMSPNAVEWMLKEIQLTQLVGELDKMVNEWLHAERVTLSRWQNVVCDADYEVVSPNMETIRDAWVRRADVLEGPSMPCGYPMEDDLIDPFFEQGMLADGEISEEEFDERHQQWLDNQVANAWD